MEVSNGQCVHTKRRLNVFHMRCLGHLILRITWQDKGTNKVVPEKTGIPSLYTLLKQRRMRWLGHVTQRKDEDTQRLKAEEKRLHKKTVCLANRPTTPFTCSKCDRDCHSRIGLHSHKRRCTMGANLWSFETDRCQ